MRRKICLFTVFALIISGSIDGDEGITPGMWRAFAELFAQTRGR